VRFDSGRPDLDLIAQEMSCPSLGHLRATGITGAKKEYFQFIFLHGSSV